MYCESTDLFWRERRSQTSRASFRGTETRVDLALEADHQVVRIERHDHGAGGFPLRSASRPPCRAIARPINRIEDGLLPVEIGAVEHVAAKADDPPPSRQRWHTSNSITPWPGKRETDPGLGELEPATESLSHSSFCLSSLFCTSRSVQKFPKTRYIPCASAHTSGLAPKTQKRPLDIVTRAQRSCMIGAATTRRKRLASLRRIERGQMNENIMFFNPR